jgi:NADPH:quinone reductase-like Zn-dependent oxidoreductase
MRVAGFGVAHPKNPVLGTDVSGRVVEIGAGVDTFTVGDEVFGFADGSYAEYVVAPADKLAHKPAPLSFEQAAAVPVSGVTALQAVTEVGQVRPGQSVLVIGASGGVGSYAVQIARALGATVTGVASGEKADLVRSLGAEDVIDYRTTEYLDGSRQFDLIIDTGGLNPIRRLRKALTRKGTLVIVGGEGGGKLTGGIGRQLGTTLLSPFVSHRLRMFLSSGTSELLDRLAQFLDTGDVLPAVGKQYEFDRATDAISDLVTGAARGKSVITIK